MQRRKGGEIEKPPRKRKACEATWRRYSKAEICGSASLREWFERMQWNVTPVPGSEDGVVLISRVFTARVYHHHVVKQILRKMSLESSDDAKFFVILMWISDNMPLEFPDDVKGATRDMPEWFVEYMVRGDVCVSFLSVRRRLKILTWMARKTGVGYGSESLLDFLRDKAKKSTYQYVPAAEKMGPVARVVSEWMGHQRVKAMMAQGVFACEAPEDVAALRELILTSMLVKANKSGPAWYFLSRWMPESPVVCVAGQMHDVQYEVTCTTLNGYVNHAKLVPHWTREGHAGKWTGRGCADAMLRMRGDPSMTPYRESLISTQVLFATLL